MKILTIKLLVLITSILQNLSEDGNIDRLLKQPFIIIPLGRDCMSALQLKNFGLRKASFPLDWVTTYNVADLISLIDNDFADFIDFSQLQIVNKNGSKRVIHTKYEIECPHLIDPDFVTNSAEGLVGPIIEKELIVQQFQRRIKRLYTVCQSGVPVYFLRIGYTAKEEAYELYETLKKKFPNGNLILICLTTFYVDAYAWEGNDHIIHLFINPSFDLNRNPDGKGHPDMRRMFVKLGWL